MESRSFATLKPAVSLHARRWLIVLVAMAACACLFLGGCAAEEQQSQDSEATQQEQEEYIEVPENLAADAIAPASQFSGGSGTQEDPYQIASAEELSLLASKVNSTESADKEYHSASYVLTADIELNDVASYDTWSDQAPEYSWVPIGTYEHSFDGSFDGMGHTVSGLYLCVGTQEHLGNEGLFGYVSHASISNLTIEKAFIRCLDDVDGCGSLAGQLIKTTISNCASDAVISVESATVGGLLGRASETDVADCASSGSVSASVSTDDVGGLIGSFTGGAVSLCSNEADVLADSVGHVGGLIGRLDDSGSVSGDYVEKKSSVAGCENYGSVVGGQGTSSSSLGGIVGLARISRSAITIDSCGNHGAVQAGFGYVGGIVGDAMIGTSYNQDYASDTFAMTITNCSNEGAVGGAASEQDLSFAVGGIVGYADTVTGIQSTYRIESCSNSGNITADNGASAGGICGKALILNDAPTDMKITNCTNSGGLGTNASSSGGIVGDCFFTVASDLSGLVSEFASETFYGDSEAKTEDEIASMSKAAGSMEISGCTNSADFTFPEGSNAAGGIVGGASLSTSEISFPLSVVDCSNSGGIDAAAQSNIGGIIGYMTSIASVATIQNCVSSGAITAQAKAPELSSNNPIELNAIKWALGGIVGKAPSSLVNIVDCQSTGGISVDGAKTVEVNGEQVTYIETSPSIALAL